MIMSSYLYKGQFLRCIGYYLSAIAYCATDIGLAYIMSVCVELAMGDKKGNLVGYGIAFLFFVIACYFITIMFHKVRDKVLMTARANLCDDVMRQIEKLEIIEFRKKNTGEWLSTLTNDIGMVSDSYFSIILELSSDAFGFIVSAILLIRISPVLSIFVITIAVLQMIIPKIMGPKIAAAKSELSKSSGVFSSTVSEHLQGYDILKSFHLTEYSLNVMSNANHEMEKKRFITRFLSSRAHMLSYAFGNISYIGLYFIGAILVSEGSMTLGALVGASQLAVYVLGPLQTISGQVSEILGVRSVVQSLEKINTIQTDQTGIVQYKTVPDYEFISVENMSFSYENKVVFQNANLTVRKGKKYIIKSPSGAGKTTLVRLIMGALKPDSGKIRLNNIDISKISPEEYARICIVCAQKNFIFHDTLRNNVTMFDHRYTDEEVLEALRQVGFSEVLDRDKDGLDMIILQNGSNLSGGERQRLELARLELLKAPCVILDESFANLDQKTTTELINQVTADKDRTVVLISHQILGEDEMKCFDSLIEIEHFGFVETVLRH